MFQQLWEEHKRFLDQLGKSQTPFEAVGSALDLFIFTFYLYGAVSEGRIKPEDFPSPLRILTESAPLTVDRKYTSLELRGVAWNLLLAAESTSAIVTDTKLESLGPRNSNDTSDLGSARNIIYCIRNAFAHNPFRPHWRCDERYQRTYLVKAINVRFDGKLCNGKELKPDDYGGLQGYMRLLGFCCDVLR